MKRLTITVAVTAIIAISATSYLRLSSANAAPKVTEGGHLLSVNEDHLAVSGFDVVSYFADGRPAKGSDRFSTRWHGATWQFASQDHLDKFNSQPERYAPQYGGYCAWGVAAKDDLFETDPMLWKIVDGKLYLNFNEEVQQTWLGDIGGFIRSADQKWPSLVQKNTK